MRRYFHRRLLVCGFVHLVLATSVPYADSWVAPYPRAFASDDGRYWVTIVPDAASRYAETARALLFTFDADGGERIVWDRRLLNDPADVSVVHNGDAVFVVTVDTWTHIGYEHAVVVYSPMGEVVADLHLNELLPEVFIRLYVPHTVSSRWWRDVADIHIRYDNTLGIDFPDIPVSISIDLATGRIDGGAID
ncbi:MAG: hypothetical protein MI724_11440 [Spirochaetales bacterium]|nr:hypothetical protein [Spirochaetales bacterium]